MTGMPVALAVDGPELFLATSGGQVFKVQSGGAGEINDRWSRPDCFRGPWDQAIRSLAVAGPDLYVGGLFWPFHGVEISGQAGDLSMLVRLDREGGMLPRWPGIRDDPRSRGPSRLCMWPWRWVRTAMSGGQFEQLGGLPRLGLAVLATPDAPLLQEQAGWFCTVTRNPKDGPEVSHFRIVGVTGGTLFLNDRVTRVSQGRYA